MVANAIRLLCIENGGSPEALLEAVAEGSVYIEPIVVDNNVAGICHYTLQEGYIEPHFAVLKAFWGKTLEASKQTLERMRSKHNINIVQAFIPENNRLACKYVSRLGWKKTGSALVEPYGNCHIYRGEY